MAATAPAVPAAPVDPEAYYEVTLSRSVRYGGHEHSPSDRVVIKGVAWPIFKDAIIASRKLSPGSEGQL